MPILSPALTRASDTQRPKPLSQISAPHAFRGQPVPSRAGLHRTLSAGFYTVCHETSRESPFGLISCQSAKVLLAPSLSTMHPREQPHRARRMFIRMVQQKPLASPLSEPQLSASASSSAAGSRCSFRSLNRARQLRPPTLFTILLSDLRFQAPAANRHSRTTPLSGHQRRASATGLTSQNLLAEPHDSPALRPTLLSVSPCEDTEKTSVSSTGTLQPPLAGILLRRQLRRPKLPADPPCEVSVQSTSHSNLHSQSNPSFEELLESTCYHRFDHH